VRDGASVIDLGPQSTRPGYTEISAEDEIERFAKPLELVKRNFEVPVSVDTYFEKSAKVALELGADMINDIWGLTHDAGMAKTVAAYDASICIMHNAKHPLSGDIWQPIQSFLASSVKLALDAGSLGIRFVWTAAWDSQRTENRTGSSSTATINLRDLVSRCCSVPAASGCSRATSRIGSLRLWRRRGRRQKRHPVRSGA